MTSTPVPTFERALQRDGDDLYRLALLLTPDVASAEATLLRAVASLASAETIHDTMLITALFRALPPDRSTRRVRPPAWTYNQPLLVQIAQLPRTQRLALALALLRSWDAERAAPLFADDPTAFQRAARDALLTLVKSQEQRDRTTGDGSMLELLDPANAPAECQPTRTMLALTAATGRHDAVQRGHLALCAACRAAEQTWQQLTTMVDQALRGALRDEHLPPALAEKLILAANTKPVAGRRVPVRWLRWALPLVVIGIVAALIFPRQSTNTAGTAAAPPQPPHELVQRAIERLYAPPVDATSAHQGQVWHGRWQIHWVFSDQSSATLNADAWIDPAASRHRVQLAHVSGGGPYEFELADGNAEVLYAVTPNYNAQLYPSDLAVNATNVRLQTNAEQQQALLKARLQSGAWSIAANYLHQAQAALSLQSWGRRQAADGVPLDIISFRGNSPLGLPVGTPDAPADTTTFLLSLDARDGTLREVSEVSGPAGGEQTSQVVWQFVSDEWLAEPDDINAAFDVRRAWNGAAKFPEHEQHLLNPALPLSTPNDFLPTTQALLDRWTWGRLPTVLPPGTESAALINLVAPDARTAMYVGDGRRLMVRRLWDASQLPTETSANAEHITLAERTITLYPHAPQSYDAFIVVHPANGDQLSSVVYIQSHGYQRTELLNIIDSLGPLTPQMLADQSRVFTNALVQSSAVHDALMQALVPPAETGVRHTVERTFTRQANDMSDPLSDPYHRALFGKRPTTTIAETWFRRLPNGRGEVALQVRDDQQTYTRWYDSPAIAWNYDLVRDEVIMSSDDGNGADGLTTIQRQVLQLLNCPTAALEQRDGQRTITVTEPDWQNGSCSHPQYGDLLNNQLINASQSATLESGPSLSDLVQRVNASRTADVPLTTLLYLDQRGQPTRSETYLGNEDRTLVEAVELITDQVVAETQVPPNLFTEQPPAAFITDNYTGGLQVSTIHTITITEAHALLSTPLLTLAPDQQYTLIRTEAGNRVAANRLSASDPVEDAIEHGLAVRLRYKLVDNAPQPLLHLVQGDAKTFGAFLRARARWITSNSVQFSVGDQIINGWRVKVDNGRVWTLFELDGTLVAADVDAMSNDTEAAPAALLQRLVNVE